MKLYAVIPGYNESKHIGKVIDDVRKYCSNIIIVDDGSADDMASIASSKHATVLKHIVNLGKGAALKTGAEYAIKQGADALIFIDSDGQHDPRLIPKFIKELKTSDIVFGYRSFNKTMPLIFRIGNIGLSLITKLLFGMDIRDTQSGYRAMTAEAYKKVRWESTQYSVETEMIANAGKAHLRYSEIPIPTIYNDRNKGTTVFDGISIFIDMIIWRLKR